MKKGGGRSIFQMTNQNLVEQCWL